MHLQLSLRISPFDRCKLVDELKTLRQGRKHTLRTFVSNPLVHIPQKEKFTLEIKAKIPAVNKPLWAFRVLCNLSPDRSLLHHVLVVYNNNNKICHHHNNICDKASKGIRKY